MQQWELHVIIMLISLVGKPHLFTYDLRLVERIEIRFSNGEISKCL